MWVFSAYFFKPLLNIKSFEALPKKGLFLNKSLYKDFYLKKQFNNVLGNEFNCGVKACALLKSNKTAFKFFVKKTHVRKRNKKVALKNLFSLFFFNLLIYFFMIYFFVFWFNNLLNITLYKNSLFLLKILKNTNIYFYKANFMLSRNKRKARRESMYFLKNLKFNKHYLIYNKLNLLRLNNSFMC